MKCILIHRPGLLGTLAYIRRTAAQSTWIFKDTLGLFHLTSQRERSRPLYPHSCLIALSPTLTSVTLLHFKIFPPIWFVSHCLLLFFPKSPNSFLWSSHLPAVSCFCGSSALRSHWGRWRDEHLSFPLCLHPAQPAGCQCVEKIEMR